MVNDETLIRPVRASGPRRLDGAVWTSPPTRRGFQGSGIPKTPGGLASWRARHRLLGGSIGGPTGPPQPSMHALSPLLKDHILLVLSRPIMPEDKARDGFDAGRLP